MKRTELGVFLVVLAIAAGMRLYGLNWAPPGLSPGEAVNGNAALAVLHSGTLSTSLFTNAQALSVHWFGNTAFALRQVAALVGILTIVGVYLLARRMFDNWPFAAVAAYLMSVGIWHVHFSRLGFGAIAIPLCAVWGLYYLYKGIETHRLWHWAIAGALFGLGFYTDATFCIMPLVIACILAAYWFALHAVFHHEKYLYTRQQMLGGAALMIGIMILIVIPLLAYFSANPQPIVSSWNALWLNIVDTFRMLFTSPAVLFLPLAAIFAVGILRTLWRFVNGWRVHGHPGVVHTVLLAWFFIGLIPSFLTADRSPDAADALIVAPAVYILVAVGLHWLFTWLKRWYAQSGHNTLAVAFALCAFLLAIGVADGSRYFVQWARDLKVAAAFSVQSTEIAHRLNTLPPAVIKYVVVPSTASSQPVMFLTDTGSAELQKEKNIFYLTEKQFKARQYRAGAVVLQLTP